MFEFIVFAVQVMSAFLKVGVGAIIILAVANVALLIRDEIVIAGGFFMIFLTSTIFVELKMISPVRRVFTRRETKTKPALYSGRHRLDGKLDDETIVGKYYTWKKKLDEDKDELFAKWRDDLKPYLALYEEREEVYV